MCTFEIFKDVLVKMWIPRHWIFLSAKVIVSKPKCSLCSELSFSVLQDILSPRGVLTVLLRIRLNIFHKTKQLMAVYLNYYESQNIDFVRFLLHPPQCNSESSRARFVWKSHRDLHRRPWRTAAASRDPSLLNTSSWFMRNNSTGCWQTSDKCNFGVDNGKI